MMPVLKYWCMYTMYSTVYSTRYSKGTNTNTRISKFPPVPLVSLSARLRGYGMAYWYYNIGLSIFYIFVLIRGV
jgi:hypothetical protein